MKLVALAAAALLAPPLVAAPPRAPGVVAVTVGHDRARGFVAGDGLVVTVAHVLEGAAARRDAPDVPDGDDGTTSPILVDGRRATVVRVDRGSDLALLRVPGIESEAPRLGGGDGTRLLGRPAPVARRVNASVDGGPRRPALVLRAHVSVGDSGAPVLTDSGRIAGVVFARSRTRATTAYAVDAAAVSELLGHNSSP